MLRIPKAHLLTLLIIWLSIHILLFHQYGMRHLFDADGYVAGADFLIDNGKFIDNHHIFYSTHIGLVALSRVFFPGQILPYLLFQCLLSGIAMLCLYRASSEIFASDLAGFLTGILFLLWWDNIQWNSVAMTESLFTSLICILIFCLTRFRNLTLIYLWIALLWIGLFFTRPTGIIVIVATIGFLLHYHWIDLEHRIVYKTIIIFSVLIISVIGCLLIFQHWDFTEQYQAGSIVTYMDRIEGQPLYHPELVVKPVNIKFLKEGNPALKIIYFIFLNPWYFFKTACLKVWYLVTFVRPYYSYSHNIYSLVWMSVLYILAYVGFKKAKKSSVKLFTLVLIFVNCGLIAISSVDWDNRFFMPMVPVIAMMAGGGGAWVFLKLRALASPEVKFIKKSSNQTAIKQQ